MPLFSDEDKGRYSVCNCYAAKLLSSISFYLHLSPSIYKEVERMRNLNNYDLSAMKKKIIEIAVKMIVAALTAFVTAITTTSCMGYGPF